AKQAIGLAVGAGCKIKRFGVGVLAAAQGQCPQPVDNDRLAVAVSECTPEIPVRIECIYLPIAEIADEDIAAESTKGERSPRNTPRRIQWSAAREALEQISIGVVDVDEAIARTSYVVVLFRVLEGIGDEEIAVDVLDPERGKTSREI